MFTLANHPQTLQDVLKDAFIVFKKTLKPCLPLALVCPLLAGLLELSDLLNKINPDNHVGPNLLFFLVGTAITLFITGVLLHWMHALITNKAAPLDKSISVIRSKFIRLFIAGLCFYTLVGLGLVALVVPGLIAMVFLLFYMPAVVFDEAGMFSSLARSYKLVYGNWWQTLGLCVVVAMAVSIVSVMMGLLMLLGKLAAFLGSSFFMAIVSLFVTALIIVQFNNLKHRYLQREIQRKKKTNGTVAH